MFAEFRKYAITPLRVLKAMLTPDSRYWDHETAGYLGEAAQSPNIHSRKEACRLASRPNRYDRASI